MENTGLYDEDNHNKFTLVGEKEKKSNDVDDDGNDDDDDGGGFENQYIFKVPPKLKSEVGKRRHLHDELNNKKSKWIFDHTQLLSIHQSHWHKWVLFSAGKSDCIKEVSTRGAGR